MTMSQRKVDSKKAQKLVAIAERAIKVIHGIEAGALKEDIITMTGASRQLVNYYLSLLTVAPTPPKSNKK